MHFAVRDLQDHLEFLGAIHHKPSVFLHIIRFLVCLVDSGRKRHIAPCRPVPPNMKAIYGKNPILPQAATDKQLTISGAEQSFSKNKK